MAGTGLAAYGADAIEKGTENQLVPMGLTAAATATIGGLRKALNTRKPMKWRTYLAEDSLFMDSLTRHTGEQHAQETIDYRLDNDLDQYGYQINQPPSQE